MVYGIFYLPERLSTPLLRDRHHFDDSKVLTPAVRSALLRALCTAPAAAADALSTSCGWAVSVLSARDIAAGMHAGHNLNAQAQAATVALVRGAQARGADVRAVFVDTVGPPAAYQAALARALPGLQVTVAKKADSLYPCVSAASVVAKVTRDAALEALWRGGPGAGGEAAAEAEVKIPVQAQAKRKRDEESSPTMAWGSGYPSDTRCVTWLRANMHPVFGWGPECRFSWGTAKDMLEEKGSGGVRVEWPADDDDDDHGENARVTDFFVSEDGHNKEHDDTADELASWFGTPAGVEAF
ncbi:hypothetical protein P8C59_006023 [Phyllachora maydis]|uniref:Ribonuclease n=1 Tax=Phyllachora maydis TaxID=1825666 RepID=A0AAD9I6U5_9PEZI|nr:hypothetical protein P8C59_006023 [Phyllachora maydis]